MVETSPVIFLMGPTASGKTDLAVELVQRLPLEIVSVDSALVYKGMDIGTSKPDVTTLSIAPHRLIDICDPADPYSAARFRVDALREIDEIRRGGKIPLLVGGTMLYFRALQQGLSELPSADPEVRQRLDDEAAQKGWAALHEKLQRVDPQAARRIHPNDPQRIQRALEVYELTGMPMTALLGRAREASLPFKALKLAVAPSERTVLRERIALRFHQMLEHGFVEEVNRFYNRGDLTPDMPSMRAVGYRQIWDYLDGKYDDETMTQRAVTATRQLAKRQMTWLRAEREVSWFESGAKDVVGQVLRELRKYHIE